MKNLSKYITLNLLSILGYIFFILATVVVFILYPDARTYDFNSGEDMPYGIYGLVSFLFPIISTFILIELTVLISIIIEFIVYKIRKAEPKVINLPDEFKKTHYITVLVGGVLSLIPLGIMCYWIINP